MKYSTRLHIHNLTFILLFVVRMVMRHSMDRLTGRLFIVIGIFAVRELGTLLCRCPHCKSHLYKSGAVWPPNNTCKVCGNKAMPDADPAKAPFFAKIPGFNVVLWVLFAVGWILLLQPTIGDHKGFPWPQYSLGLALMTVVYFLIPWDRMYRHALKNQPPEDRLGD